MFDRKEKCAFQIWRKSRKVLIIIWNIFIFLGLLDLANSYCEQQLKRRCERIIKQGITVENVAMLYATAIKYQVRHIKFRSEFYMFSINIPKINENSRMCILALKFVLFLRARLEWSELHTLQKINSRKGVEFSADYILILILIKFNVEKATIIMIVSSNSLDNVQYSCIVGTIYNSPILLNWIVNNYNIYLRVFVYDFFSSRQRS